MSEDAVRIIADLREQSSGVIEELRLMPQVEVVVQQLKCGDYDLGNRQSCSSCPGSDPRRPNNSWTGLEAWPA